jgi:hypothetical protein
MVKLSPSQKDFGWSARNAGCSGSFTLFSVDDDARSIPVRRTVALGIIKSRPMTRQAYIHHPSRTVIFWTYKAANTSIVHALAFDILGLPRSIGDPRPALERYRANYSHALALIEQNSYRSIALIREPYDRLISAFLHIFVARENIGITSYDQLEVVGRTGYAAIAGDRAGAFAGLVFRQFVEHCLSAIRHRGREPLLDGHWNTQIPFEFLHRRFEYDFLYPLEQSSEFFKRLAKLTGKPVVERRVNEHKRSETRTPRNLVDTPSVEYCNDATLRHPGNFEDRALRAEVEQAYALDRIFLETAQAQFYDVKGNRSRFRPIPINWSTVPEPRSIAS